MKMAICPTGQVFRLEYNVVVFQQNLQIAYLMVQAENGKFIRKKKKIRVKFVRKYRQFGQVKNFDQNAMSPFLHENLQRVYLEVSETIGKFYRNEK